MLVRAISAILEACGALLEMPSWPMATQEPFIFGEGEASFHAIALSCEHAAALQHQA